MRSPGPALIDIHEIVGLTERLRPTACESGEIAAALAWTAGEQENRSARRSGSGGYDDEVDVDPAAAPRRTILEGRNRPAARGHDINRACAEPRGFRA